jgi:SAM-dependent methyltransferase
MRKPNKEKNMNTSQNDELKKVVKEHYGKVAVNASGCCGSGSSPCCGPGESLTQISEKIGYRPDEISQIPDGADLGLGCGNPLGLAKIKEGDTILDLGSGGGIDCFIASKKVGPLGKVIGVDMTPEMITRARRNAEAAGYKNVEFRLGDIEALPVADDSVNLIISNCVINLSPNKRQVYAEAFRVLKPGGEISISDIVAFKPLSEEWRKNLEAFAACVSGAALIDDLLEILKTSGFVDIQITPDSRSRQMIKEWFPGSGLEEYITSAHVSARKP